MDLGSEPRCRDGGGGIGLVGRLPRSSHLPVAAQLKDCILDLELCLANISLCAYPRHYSHADKD